MFQHLPVWREVSGEKDTVDYETVEIPAPSKPGCAASSVRCVPGRKRTVRRWRAGGEATRERITVSRTIQKVGFVMGLSYCHVCYVCKSR